MLRNGLKQMQHIEKSYGLPRPTAFSMVKTETLAALEQIYPEKKQSESSASNAKTIPGPSPILRENIDLEVEKSLIQSAHKGLAGGKVDMLDFILKADNNFYQYDSKKLSSEQKKFIQLFQKAREALGKPPYSKEKIFKALDIIYNKSIRYYRGKYRSVLDYFDVDENGRVGANCGARTKIISALFQDDPNVKIQIYGDHVQPVWVGDGEIIDLVSREPVQSVLATIYEKDIVYLSYLAPREKTPLSAYQKYYYSGVSPIRFENGKLNFTWPQNHIAHEGDVPDYQDNGPIGSKLEEVKQISPALDSEGKLSYAIGDRDLISLFELTGISYEHKNLQYALEKYADIIQIPSESFKKLKLLYLGNQKYIDEFSKIKDETERGLFLDKILLKEFLAQINSKEFQFLTDRLKNAKSISDLSNIELEKIKEYMLFFDEVARLVRSEGPLIKAKGNLKVMFDNIARLEKSLSPAEYIEKNNNAPTIFYLARTLYPDYVSSIQNHAMEDQMLVYKNNPKSYIEAMLESVDNTSEMESLVNVLLGENFGSIPADAAVFDYLMNVSGGDTSREDYTEILDLLIQIQAKNKTKFAISSRSVDTLILTSIYFDPTVKGKITDPRAKELYLNAFENLIRMFDSMIAEIEFIQKEGDEEGLARFNKSELNTPVQHVLHFMCPKALGTRDTAEFRSCSKFLKEQLAKLKTQTDGFYPYEKPENGEGWAEVP